MDIHTHWAVRSSDGIGFMAHETFLVCACLFLSVCLSLCTNQKDSILAETWYSTLLVSIWQRFKAIRGITDSCWAGAARLCIAPCAPPAES